MIQLQLITPTITKRIKPKEVDNNPTHCWRVHEQPTGDLDDRSAPDQRI